MRTVAVRALEDCARSCTVETWEAFDSFFRPRLVAGITRAICRGGVRPDAERVGEMLQEVYCRLLEDRRAVLRRFRGRTDRQAFAYLKRIAESVTIDRLREEAAAKRGGSLVQTGLPEGIGERLPDASISPEARLVAREVLERLWRECRRHVASRSRARDLAILQLALFEGWTSREIAAALDHALTVSSIDTIVHRLRRRLAAQGIALPPRSVSAREVAEQIATGEPWGS